MAISLYGFRMSPPFRSVLLTARAVGVKIQEKNVDFQKLEHKNEAFLKMNPTHTVPVLDDNGFCMWESRAIMGYLVQQYGKDDSLYPKDPKKRALVDNMLYFDASALYSGLFQFASPVLFLGKQPDETVRAAVVERLGFLNTILGNRKYVAGDRITIADFSLVVTVITAEAAKFCLKEFPNILKWMSKVKGELPYFDEVNEEGAGIFKSFCDAKL